MEATATQTSIQATVFPVQVNNHVAVRVIRPFGPEVVYAPPAFKGQQSAKGATKARFAMIEARLAAAQVSR